MRVGTANKVEGKEKVGRRLVSANLEPRVRFPDTGCKKMGAGSLVILKIGRKLRIGISFGEMERRIFLRNSALLFLCSSMLFLCCI